jgi:tetratricopeptide (TPR) repeat protein
MNNRVKLILYIVFLTGACVCGWKFYQTYTAASARAAAEKLDPPAVAETNAPPVTGTNAVPDPAETDPATNTAALTNASPAQPAKPVDTGRHYGRMMSCGAMAFACVVGLAMLLAHDVSRITANRVEDFLFNDDGAPMVRPEYDEAEEVWTDGRHLEAIQLMRDYLKKNPSEIYVALRIAEIYEKDLLNPLAAALEYEEVLKKKLPPDRWAWSAIHLANLYSGRLNKIDQAVALLRRIVAEQARTPAAEKARLRLAQLDAGTDPDPEPVVAEEPPPAPPEPVRPALKLPPGFRPRD